jgi:hypothetical protein
MSPLPNQIEQLKKELASGQVVVVVGSGVSVAACSQQLVEGTRWRPGRGCWSMGLIG